MQLFLLCFFIFGIFYPVFAQQQDSLNYFLSQKTSDTLKIRLSINFAKRIVDTDPNSAYLLAENIIENLNYQDYRYLKANSFYIMGYASMLVGDYEEATENLHVAFKLWEKIGNKREIARINCYLARIMGLNNDSVQAFSYAQKALKMAKSINDFELQGLANHQIAATCFFLKDFAKALPFHHQALRMRIKANDGKGIMSSFNSMGLVLSRLNKYDSAIIFYRKAQVVNQKYLYDNDLIAAISDNLGDAFLALNQYDSSLFYLQKGFKIAQKARIKRRVMESYESFVDYYEKKNDEKTALSFHKKFLKLKDSIYNERKNQLISRLNTKYHLEIKEKENEVLRKTHSLTMYILIGVGIALFLMVLLAIVLFLAFRHRKKSLGILQKQQAEILSKNTVLELQKAEIMTQNEELHQQQEEIIAQRDFIAKANNELSYQYSQIRQSVETAKLIQDAILPQKDKVHQFLPHYFVFYRPKDVVSGDFFWIEQIENKIFMAVIDCTGHGVPGAFMSMIANTLLNNIVKVQHIFSPDKILQALNEEIQGALKQKETENNNGMDAAFIYVEKENGSFKLSFSGAKRPLYYVSAQTKQLEVIKGDKISIGGKYSFDKIFTNQIIELPYNSTFYLFSDGYADQCDPQRIAFGTYKLHKLISEIAPLEMKTQKEMVVNTLDSFRQNAEQRDDILLVGVKVER